jgi:hypothetical protein
MVASFARRKRPCRLFSLAQCNSLAFCFRCAAQDPFAVVPASHTSWAWPCNQASELCGQAGLTARTALSVRNRGLHPLAQDLPLADRCGWIDFDPRAGHGIHGAALGFGPV